MCGIIQGNGLSFTKHVGSQVHVPKVLNLGRSAAISPQLEARLTHSLSGKYLSRQGLQGPAGQRVPWPG